MRSLFQIGTLAYTGRKWGKRQTSGQWREKPEKALKEESGGDERSAALERGGH
jgi:hypothetical protein